jgi:hypothetical protein
VGAIATLPHLCFRAVAVRLQGDATGRTTDFNAVYQQIIAPAVQEAGLDSIRGDEERVGGTIHKLMLDGSWSANTSLPTSAAPIHVFYELRHPVMQCGRTAR